MSPGIQKVPCCPESASICSSNEDGKEQRTCKEKQGLAAHVAETVKTIPTNRFQDKKDKHRQQDTRWQTPRRRTDSMRDGNTTIRHNLGSVVDSLWLWMELWQLRLQEPYACKQKRKLCLGCEPEFQAVPCCPKTGSICSSTTGRRKTENTHASSLPTLFKQQNHSNKQIERQQRRI